MLADWQMQVSGVMRLDLNTWGFEWTQTKDKITDLAAKEDFDMRLKSSITKTKQKLNM